MTAKKRRTSWSFLYKASDRLKGSRKGARKKPLEQKRGLDTRKPETKGLGSLIPEVSEDKPGTHLGSPRQKTPKKVKNIRSRKPDTRSLRRKSKSKDLRRQLLYIRFRNKTT